MGGLAPPTMAALAKMDCAAVKRTNGRALTTSRQFARCAKAPEALATGARYLVTQFELGSPW